MQEGSEPAVNKDERQRHGAELGAGGRKWWGWLIVGVLIIILAMALRQRELGESQVADEMDNQGDLSGVQHLAASQYDKLADQPELFVLDVHVPEQIHLPNTDAFIPFNQIQARANELPDDKSVPILVYCRSGSMSRQASTELVEMGYRTVYDLTGGAIAYREMEGSVELVPGVQDLGTVVYGEVARTRFTLVNNTERVVMVGKVSTSCSCTKAEVKDKQIEPAERVTVEVSFDPAVHKDDHDLGKVTRSIFIDTDHPNFGEITAEIKALVVEN